MKNCSVVRAQIDAETKNLATETLAELGISTSEFIRMALSRVARDKAIPFDVKVVNTETRAAMLKTAQGEDTHRAKDATDLFKQLEI